MILVDRSRICKCKKVSNNQENFGSCHAHLSSFQKILEKKLPEEAIYI